LQRNDLEYRKPKLVPGKLNPAKQQAFIDGYENFLNNLDVDEAVVFADAAHPTHEVRPAGCWSPGRWCFGKTPMQTFLDAIPITKEKRSQPDRIGHENPTAQPGTKCQS
jgi:hypothetical protein